MLHTKIIDNFIEQNKSDFDTEGLKLSSKLKKWKLNLNYLVQAETLVIKIT